MRHRKPIRRRSRGYQLTFNVNSSRADTGLCPWRAPITSRGPEAARPFKGFLSVKECARHARRERAQKDTEKVFASATHMVAKLMDEARNGLSRQRYKGIG